MRFHLVVLALGVVFYCLYRKHEEQADLIAEVVEDGAFVYQPDGILEYIEQSLPGILANPLVINKNALTNLQNATFLVLCRNQDVYELLETIQSVQDRFNHRYGYDWTFLNDKPFSVDFVNTIVDYIPRGRLNFGQIPPEQWSYPDWVNQTFAAEQRESMANENVLYALSESYRFMCRYYLGFFYRHELVAKYQYYWRLEPGIKLYCDINYDVFQFMKLNNKKYGFTMTIFEYSKTIPSLWFHFKQFIKENIDYNPPLLEFVQNDDTLTSYNECHFWSNFEIADLSIFDNDQYNHFFNYLDQTGGFFYERWGDAPIHSLAILLFLTPNDLWWFGDIGYYHAPYLQCPQLAQLRLQNKCSCNPNEDFTDSFLSCTRHILDIINSY
ncbi:mannosyltransferase [Hyphopichia burtonii NRRL Y-1933]|uniref:Mannosyltransferase n=1 Tax=Hyphopichia burtonii NRRL Y-1933 TaxID=984485 RepID=A0A1E4RQX5_9ASCO|nr:mannosyltransferase [Hyphopichia burtonii NRRL Y-1933]ODV69657.1 mannosyltransferase [Hyphopichia burtonii NRRL Y-1933]